MQRHGCRQHNIDLEKAIATKLIPAHRIHRDDVVAVVGGHPRGKLQHFVRRNMAGKAAHVLHALLHPVDNNEQGTRNLKGLYSYTRAEAKEWEEAFAMFNKDILQLASFYPSGRLEQQNKKPLSFNSSGIEIVECVGENT